VSFGVVAAAVLVLAGCSDQGSNPASSDQSVPPTTTSQSGSVSFQNQVKPIFQRYGCASCHGGSGGLFVQSVAQLLQGGADGPAIVQGKADNSLIIKKLSSAPPFGDRMPQGGPYLPDSTVQVIKDWINQGAKDN
jgi:mono/diheme cytochrome c family protein